MTHPSVLTTQSKLTVQAPGFGERGARQMSHPLAMDGRVSLKPWTARRDLVHCPAFGVGRLNGSLLGCLRKDVALCHIASHCVPG